MKRILLTTICMALVGCASTTATTTVTNTVAEAEVALTAADGVALAYVTQPQCPVGTVAWTCSDPVTVTKIKGYAAKAYTAVKAAEANTGTIAAAMTAVGLLTTAVPTSGATP